ncbi:MAG TPA: acyl-CoA dehydrogenase family protein [Coleofasciculaceae cyanobacterium]
MTEQGFEAVPCGDRASGFPAWLDRAAAQLLETIAPQADLLDRDPAALAAAIDWLGAQGWLALKVPPDWGGRGISEAEYGRFREVVARCSGALAFLQAQHQSAAGLIANGDNEALKQRYLPAIAQGTSRLGIAFSHLRRVDDLPIEGRAVPGGWEICGTAPWVTGLGYFPEAVLAVPTEAGVLFCLVPLVATEQRGCVQPGPLMSLGAMGSTQTAAVVFDRWFVPTELVVGLEPIDWVQQFTRRGVLQGVYFVLGCTQAALDRLAESFTEKRLLAIAATHDTLRQDLDRLRQAIYGISPTAPYHHKLQLRGQAIALMGRAVQAVLMTQGGRAMVTTHPASRLQGEANIFATSGQTLDILAAALGAIVGAPLSQVD